MPSNSKEKIEFPMQFLAESSKAETIVIKVDAANPNPPISKRKEEAGKPLYLKRV